MTKTKSQLSKHTDDLIRELADLRFYGDCVRTTLYWNIQRLCKSRRTSTEFTAHLRRRKHLRLRTDAA